MFITPISQAGAAAMAMACLFALIRGAWPERLAGATLAINWIGCEALEDRRFLHAPLHHLVQPAIATIDLAYAALLFAIVVCSYRKWVVAAFGLQLLIVILHLATALDPRISHFDFFSAYFVASWLILIALAVGTAVEARPDNPPGSLIEIRGKAGRRARAIPPA